MKVDALIRIIAVVALMIGMYGILRFQSYYFTRPDVLARRAAKAKLPSWLNSLEMGTWLFLYLVIGYVLLQIIENLNSMINPGTYPSGAAIVPIIVAALPIAMLASNVIFWAIPYTRRIEDENAKGVPGASFGESNMGLLKVAFVIEPICLLVICYGLGLFK